MKKILISGGAGFIGSHLVDKLIKKKHKVTIVDNLSVGKKENLNRKAKFYNIDICDSKISDIFKKEKPEFIFHLAAQINLRKSVNNPVFDAKTNLLGTLNILENCRKQDVKKVIFTSSGGAIYGEAKIIPTPEDYPAEPLSPYGINKLTAERYLKYYYKFFNLPFVSLRLANVYGPRQNSASEAGVIAIFCEQMLSRKEPTINGDGKQTRDFIFVEDVARACLLAMEKNKIGVFNIGTERETDIKNLFKKIKKMTNSKCREKQGPEKIGEQKRSCLDCAKFQKEFNWRAIYSLDKGLKRTVQWFKVKNNLVYE